jgi:hypothetical protein
VRLLRLAAVAALAAAILPAAARADADPPSDFLLQQPVYLPFFGAKPSTESANYLHDVVVAANNSGYKIKVAAIGSRGDLGGVFSLFGHPKTYAPFLAREIAFAYRGRLLASMPQGFAFYWSGHPYGKEQRIVDSVKITPGVDGLVNSTAEAVKKLAAADGHRIDIQPSGGGGGGGGSGIGTRVIIAVAGAVLIAALIVLPLLLRRRRLKTG